MLELTEGEKNTFNGLAEVDLLYPDLRRFIAKERYVRHTDFFHQNRCVYCGSERIEQVKKLQPNEDRHIKYKCLTCRKRF